MEFKDADLELRIVKKEDLTSWNRIVENVPYGTIFHTLEWMGILEEVYNVKKIPLGIYKEDDLVGVFPAFLQKKTIFELGMSPLQRTATPYGGPILLNNSFFIQAIEKFDEMIIEEYGADYVDIKISPNLITDNLDKLEDLRYEIEERYTYVLDLNRPIEEIWKNLEKRCRWAIRKARKNGVETIETEEKKLIDRYYEMVSDTWDKSSQNPLLPKKYYLKVLEIFKNKNKVKLIFSKYKDELIAGAFFLHFKDKSYFWDGASYRKYYRLAPNNIILWQFIEWAANSGIKTFDMVGAQVASISKFKRSFGGELISYPYIYRSTSPLSSSGRWFYERFLVKK